jgi:hypothetical protein
MKMNQTCFCARPSTPKHAQASPKTRKGSPMGISILKIDNSNIAILELFRNWLFWNYSGIAILELAQ